MNIKKFTEQGKRSNNEDSLGITKGLLTVCDGVGGHVSGEIASGFVVKAMTEAFLQPQPIGKSDIQNQLHKVQEDLSAQLEAHPEQERMGTTFAGVFITPKAWYAAHIGDSRIYLFRPSEQKLWHTWDHSLVGELMRTKEITVEAGRFHPLSNHIDKAIIAQRDREPVEASVVELSNLKAGDILLLCSDGVVEAWGDWELVRLFTDTSLSFKQKCENLRLQCAERSRDNNTAIIAEITEEDAFSFGDNKDLEWTSFSEVEADFKRYLKENEKEEDKEDIVQSTDSDGRETPKHKTGSSSKVSGEPTPCPINGGRKRKWGLVIIFLSILAVVLYYLLKGGK